MLKLNQKCQRSSASSDLNESFRAEGLARFKKIVGECSTPSIKDLSLWSCLLLKEPPFSDTVPRAILVGDSHWVPHFKNTHTYLELSECIQSFLPTLFMAQTAVALNRGALPGEGTLHSPLFTSLHRKAIASAKCVVSFHLEPLLAALANRVPAILIAGRASNETELAKKIGIPVVIGNNPKKMVAEVGVFFTHYPWKKVDQFCREIMSEFSFLEKLSERSLEKSERINRENLNLPFTVCSMTDSNYLPFFLGFIENLNDASQGNFKCFLLALDSNVAKQIKKLKLASHIEVVTPADLWTPKELPVIEARSIGCKAFSSKPKLISWGLQKTDGPVFYCDSDVFFCEPVSQLRKVIETEKMVLFPHLNDVFPSAQLDGLFNAGMVVVAPGAENFLDWWSELCFRECEFNRERGVVGDQAYLNLVPILFTGVKIYQERNHNVARWNSKTLNLDLDLNSSETPIIDGGVKVSTYHAAFCDERGVYQMKFLWDHLVSFFSPASVRNSSKALATNIEFQQSNYWTHSEHVLRLQRFSERWLTKMHIRWAIQTKFWFTKTGRRSIAVLVFIHQMLNRLKIKSVNELNNPSIVYPENNSPGWVASNQKAMGKPPVKLTISKNPASAGA